MAESKQLAKRLSEIEKNHEVGVSQKFPAKRGQDDEPFLVPPARYFEKDERDEYYEAKRAVANPTADSGFGNTVLVTDDDIQYLIDQKSKSELYNFDSWFYFTFSPGADPNKLQLFREMNPEWFKRREDEIKRQVDVAKKLAKLGLRGPRNQTEIELLYALDTGRIQVPDLDELFPEKAAGRNEARNKLHKIDQGYWNPRKYTLNADIKHRIFSEGQQPYLSENHGQNLGQRENYIYRSEPKAETKDFYARWRQGEMVARPPPVPAPMNMENQ